MDLIAEKAIAFLVASRKFSLSGIIGAFVGAFLHAKYPQTVGLLADKYWFIGGCFVLGGGLQRTVEAAVRYVTPKSSREIEYYEKMQLLRRDYQRGLISSDTYNRIVQQLTEEHYLGNDKRRQLPPTS